MNEFDYEVMMRKRLARNARRKKNGSKSKRCSLPSDRMTPKQWKERNSEVMSYNLSKPMKWQEFKSMPEDLQEQYIRTLHNEHGGRQNEIAAMLGISNNTFSKYCTAKKWHIFEHTGGIKSSKDKRWETFLNGPELEQEDIKLKVVCEAEQEQESMEPPKAAETNDTMKLDFVSLGFDGPFDESAIVKSLGMIVKKGQPVHIEIRCNIYKAVL